jgi:prepilin-type processing-associated H-X9-DG protein
MHNIALGVLAYQNDHNAFPSGTWPSPSMPPRSRLSWYAAITPYLGEQVAYNVLDKAQPWDSELNAHVAYTEVSYLCCPNVRCAASSGPVLTPYIGIAGLGTDSPLLPTNHRRAGVFGYDRHTRPTDIRDGAACTMLIAESGLMSGSWLQGGPATVRGLDPSRQPYLGAGRQFGGLHGGGASVALADGSVRWVSNSINPKVFEALSTIAGGETLPKDW